MRKITNIRWLDIPAGCWELKNHPSAFYVDRGTGLFRVLQIHFDDDRDGIWHDVSIIEYKQPDTPDKS